MSLLLKSVVYVALWLGFWTLQQKVYVSVPGSVMEIVTIVQDNCCIYVPLYIGMQMGVEISAVATLATSDTIVC